MAATSPRCWTGSSIGRLDDLIGDEDDVAVAAVTVAMLLAHAHRPGRRRDAHDLIIAVTALARARIVVTTDRGGFGDLPGVGVRLVAGSAVEG